METVILILLVPAVLAFVGALAVAFGAESRDAFRDPNARATRGVPPDVA